jgi:serine/threonine-protein kinase
MSASRSKKRNGKSDPPDTEEIIPPEESTVLTFGQLALERGFVEGHELEGALKEQEKRRRKGKTARLGEILRERGHLTRKRIEELFKLQGTLGGHTEIEGYEILEQIGEGAMGRIFKAMQLSMDRLVALKVLAPKLAMNKKYVARFLREARLAGKLKHENIVYVIDAGISNGVHYYVMEYIEGKTLKEILAVRKMLSEKELLRLALHMTRALEHANENGVLHRDIKPSNIIVSEGRIPKLCDFGLAKDIMFDPKLTSVGTVVGTPFYISPEQIRGRANDIRSDIYSLGATLYHCACGEAPFACKGSATVMVKHLTEPPEPLRSRRPGLSEAAAAIVHKMLEKSPDDRFQTPLELWRAVEPLVFEKSRAIEVEVEEIPEPPVEKKRGKAPRRRRRKRK